MKKYYVCYSYDGANTGAAMLYLQNKFNPIEAKKIIEKLLYYDDVKILVAKEQSQDTIVWGNHAHYNKIFCNMLINNKVKKSYYVSFRYRTADSDGFSCMTLQMNGKNFNPIEARKIIKKEQNYNNIIILFYTEILQ